MTSIVRRWAGAIAGLLCCAAVQAAQPPAEVYFKDADIAEASLSPSGRLLAITTARGLTRVGLAVVDLNSGRIMRTAQFADGDIVQARWVNDGRLLFGVQDLSEGSGRPNGAPGLYAVNVDGSELRQLVRRMGRPIVSDGSGRHERLLDWNHRLLRVPATHDAAAGDEVLIAHISTGDDRTATPLWLNTRTGRTRSLDAQAPAHVVDWLTDSRGELRVALTQHAGRRAAYWRGPGQQAWRRLYESGLFEVPFNVHSVDDAGQLYVLRSPAQGRESVLARYDFERGAPEQQAMVEAPGFSFTGRLLSDAGGPALGVRLIIDGETTVWFHDAMKTLQAQADARLPGRINRIDCRRCGEADMSALVRSFSDRDPGQIWLYQAQPPAGEATWRAVGKVRNDVKPSEMALMDFHRIRARDGRDLPVWVTRSPQAQGPLPAVVLVHGGPWVRGNVWGWHAWGQFLASRGYVVIEPEFRGSTGYGHAHYRAGFKQWGQAMQDDVADALLWARQQGLASDRACIAGGSYGGYSALMGLVRHPELYRCAVAWVAVTDLELLLKGSWWVNDDTSGEARRHHLPETIGDLEKDAAMIIANSPVRQAARIQAPVLLAFGENDLRVPLAHGKRMRDALREAGHEPEWVTYPGEGHGFSILKNRVDFATRMEAFLARHLKP
ncbi:prolyl oligopeptidase family serine peptidase [Pelomonas sp. UHG3]|uniref:Prolyl oligopeptidase family serine peptidase n=1 Tax=Roseateles hydrophilus TaxID=2975054 RepID=A0ACC6C6F6_9BURK|nr:prolyl oligopeptidase family serine peptidase [Pelomonas sp. UHG3]MCY4743967.1 prolyl oligopeptidase family serine peptidase [Pelomonas sp. UHG3]